MRLDRIVIYPIKSLDGISVTAARISAGGILENDRVWALYDEAGRVVNGKRVARAHQLRCHYDEAIKEVQLWESGASSRTSFPLADTKPLNRWLSDFFGFTIEVRCDPGKGFPDDAEASGPTVVSLASLVELQAWFPELTVEELRRRFRANLELGGGAPFWEDHLFGDPNELKAFQLGEVRFLGHNPCQRCVVPSRDPDTGRGIADFSKKFAELRRVHLPAWANVQRFNHYYRFAVNTSIPPGQAGKILRLGDTLVV